VFNKGLVLCDRPYTGSATPPATFEDTSRQKYTGAFTNHATRVRLPSGLWVYSLDGTDDYINCGTAPALNFISSNFSACAWIYHTYTGAARNDCFIARGAYANDGWDMLIYDTYFYFKVYQTSPQQKQSNSGGNTALRNVWQFVCGVKTTRGYIYINGVDATASSETFYDPLSNPTRITTIGSFSNTSGPFMGRIALPRVWSRALTAAEILAIYESERRWFGV
jgi:hypothetical protein